jgi:hypothetical protein
LIKKIKKNDYFIDSSGALAHCSAGASSFKPSENENDDDGADQSSSPQPPSARNFAKAASSSSYKVGKIKYFQQFSGNIFEIIRILFLK